MDTHAMMVNDPLLTTSIRATLGMKAMEAIEQMLVSIGDLLKDLAMEEMENELTSFVEDLGPLLILLAKNHQLKQLVEAQLKG